jgi:hypothetical protein
VYISLVYPENVLCHTSLSLLVLIISDVVAAVVGHGRKKAPSHCTKLMIKEENEQTLRREEGQARGSRKLQPDERTARRQPPQDTAHRI